MSDHRPLWWRRAPEWSSRLGELVGVVLLDLDHFRQVNDVHGHATGDAVLVAVAGVLRSQVRAGDLAVRTGGEELLLIDPVTGAGDVGHTAERIRLAVEQLDVGGLPPTTASFGTAVSSADDVLSPAAQDPDGALHLIEQLASSADAAMYEAERAGRNRVRHATGTVEVSRR